MKISKPQGDPYLTFSRYLNLDARQEDQSYLLAHFPTRLTQAEKRLKALKWHKVEVTFPVDFPQFEDYLASNGFTHCLNTWALDSAGFPPQPISDPNIGSPKLAYPQLEPILAQQADYHHSLYPDYYRDWSHIDQRLYRLYVDRDVLSDHAFYLVHQSLPGQITGLILGGISLKSLNIWEWVVDSNLRGQGIGSKLLHQYLYLCAPKNITTVSVQTGNLQPAAKIYQKFGFQPTFQTWYKNYL